MALPTQKLRGVALSRQLLYRQRQWIEQCERGRSYNGPNGRAIREADEAELRMLEQAVQQGTGPIRPVRKTPTVV